MAAVTIIFIISNCDIALEIPLTCLGHRFYDDFRNTFKIEEATTGCL